MSMEIKEEYGMYFTEFREVNGTQTVAILNNQSTQYAVTGEDIFKALLLQLLETLVFAFKDRYSLEAFQGIMPDSGAVGILTAS